MNDYQLDFLTDAASFMAAHRIAETTFGRKAVNDSQFLERVRTGKVTLATIEKARTWMSEQPHRQTAAAE